MSDFVLFAVALVSVGLIPFVGWFEWRRGYDRGFADATIRAGHSWPPMPRPIPPPPRPPLAPPGEPT